MNQYIFRNGKRYNYPEVKEPKEEDYLRPNAKGIWSLDVLHYDAATEAYNQWLSSVIEIPKEYHSYFSEDVIYPEDAFRICKAYVPTTISTKNRIGDVYDVYAIPTFPKPDTGKGVQHLLNRVLLPKKLTKWEKDLETASVDDLNNLNLSPEYAELALNQFCKGAEWDREYFSKMFTTKRMAALKRRLERKVKQKSSYHLSLPEIYMLLNIYESFINSKTLNP